MEFHSDTTDCEDDDGLGLFRGLRSVATVYALAFAIGVAVQWLVH